MRYKVDAMSLRDGTLIVEGWCISSSDGKIEFSLVKRDGTPMPCTAVARDRADVAAQFGADRMSGFTLAAPFERDDDAFLVMKDTKTRRRVRVNYSIILKRNSIRAKRTEKLLALVHFETLVVSWDFIRENGLKAFTKKAIHKIQKIDEDFDYAEWEYKTRIAPEELESQSSGWKDFSYPGGHAPLISIVVPCYNTDEKSLRMLLDSIIAQTYPVFEVILADGSDQGVTKVESVYGEYAGDKRIKYVGIGSNQGISANTNCGIDAAAGDFIALVDHDDELPEYALYEVAQAIASHPRAEFIYTDEDKIDFDGKALFEPNFKPDLDIDLLCSVNYICHLSVISGDLLRRVGGMREEFDGAQDHDLFLRCIEEATREERAILRGGFFDDAAFGKGLLEESVRLLREGRFISERVIHIPKICYHWRCHKGSTALDPKSKLYAFEAGKRAVASHYERMGIAFSGISEGVTYGYYRSDFGIKDSGGEPLISVIIPNKDHTDDLDKCLRSVIERSEYKKLEFIIVENNSTEEKTFDYYRSVGEITKGTGITIRVINWEKEFNYAAINNFGAREAGGDLLFFLNNDTSLRAPESITRMAALLSRADTGIVGARLTYGDDTIQHAGVIVGLGGIAGAAFTGLHEKENSYMHRMMCLQELSAVTAAALMMRRDTFERAGGFYEELKVAFNDIDLCMKVRALGMNVIYDPCSVFYHFESKSRGLEDTPDKVRRFNNEIAIFASRWSSVLSGGDPYYNPNLTLRKSNFALRDLTKEKPGEPYALELDVEKQLRTVLREKERRGLT